MTGQFDGRVALVTGSASGIGRATAIAFARKGAKVVVSDIAVKGGEETVAMIKEIGAEAVFIEADVSKTSDVRELIKGAVDKYGRLDAAMNNAGIVGQFVPITECSEENWDRVIGINLKAVWLCMKYEIQQMLTQGGGTIVNTASIEGVIGAPYAAPYVASKHGVNGLTKSLALEWASANIRINSVCPGSINTPILDPLKVMVPDLLEMTISTTPLGRIGRPEEIANAAVWLCSDEASYITGHAMVVDGGFSVQ